MPNFDQSELLDGLAEQRAIDSEMSASIRLMITLECIDSAARRRALMTKWRTLRDVDLAWQPLAAGTGGLQPPG